MKESNYMVYNGKLVRVLCIEPNGVWAMIKFHGSKPFVVEAYKLKETYKVIDIATTAS